MPTALPKDRFLTAIEVKPGNPRVVHHTFGYVDTRGLGRRRDADDPMPGYPCFSGFTGDQIFGLLGGWTPGNDAHPFGDGVGLELPRNADVVMQVHYHPSGKPETDRTRLGLYLSKTPAPPGARMGLRLPGRRQIPPPGRMIPRSKSSPT